MTFYKIIQNNKVVDAGFVFLQWSERYHSYFLCDETKAEFVKGTANEIVYHDSWLKHASPNAPYENAEVVVIEKSEYDEIINLINGNQEIEVYVPEPKEPKPEIIQPDLPLSVNQMRQLILEQNEQISMLTDCILELSEIVYGEGSE